MSDSPGKIALDFGELNPIQKEVLEKFRSGKRIVAMIAGRQSGKSHMGARWLLARIAQPRARSGTKLSLVLAPTYRMARVAQRKLEEVLKADVRLWRSIKHLKQPIPTYEFPNGHIIEVHSTDDPDSIRGLTVDDVWFDESAKASQEAFDILIPTLLATEGSLLMTTTPRGKQNWMYNRVYLKGCPPGDPDYDVDTYNPAYATVIGSTWDNVVNLSEEAVKQLEDQYGAGSRYAAQEIEGNFVSYEGLVYSWDESNFIPLKEMPDKDSFTHIVGGLDFGWTDPTAAVVMGYKDGVWHALDGLYESEMGLNELSEQLAILSQQYGVEVWYADSASPNTINELHLRGIPVVAVKKPTLEESIRMVSIFANRNRLKVSHSAPWLRDELQTYQYSETARRGVKAPIDKNNHALDACLAAGTKISTQKGDKPIEDIRVGELVWTRQGLKRVRGAGKTSNSSKIYRVITNDGTVLRGTGNHPVYVKEKQRFVPIEELSIGDTLIASTSLPEATTNHSSSIGARGWTTYTERFTRIMWGISQRGIIFTTKIVTPLITLPVILWRSLRRNITTFTQTICLIGSSNGYAVTPEKYDPRQLTGTGAKRAGSGTDDTLRTPDLGLWSTQVARVMSVSRHMSQEIQRQGFAPTSASLGGEGGLVSITSVETVDGASNPSASISTAKLSAAPKVVRDISVEELPEPVYNLSVAGAEEYFANGVLVHNCRYAMWMFRHLWANVSSIERKRDFLADEEFHPWGSKKLPGEYGIDRDLDKTGPAGLWDL